MPRIDVLNLAKSQVGISESPPNSNRSKYGFWYAPSLDGHRWCAMFVSWVFHHAGHPLGNVQSKNGIHHCQAAHNYYKGKGQITTSPKPGDMVIFDWEGNGYADHIGIFNRWTNSQETAFEAYEGNTSIGNDSNGGSVMLRVRSRNLVKSFVSPAVYNEVTLAPSIEVLKKGARGSKVTQVQKYLYEIGYEIEIDGWFGTQTETMLKDFQSKNLMTTTGFADDVTVGALQEESLAAAVAKSKFISGSFLRRGNVGFMVTEVQRELNKRDASLQLPITGNFDLATLQAVKAFQTKNRLVADGIVGPNTFGKLGFST